MSSTPPHTGVSLPLTEFNFGDFGVDFGASFGIDADFGAAFGNLTSLGVRLPLILRVILVDHHPMIGVVDHHPMIGVVIAVDKEDGGVDVGLTDYSVLRV